MGIFRKSQYASFDNMPHDRFFFASLVAHGLVFVSILLVMQSRYKKQPLHLLQTITLVSLPVAEIENKVPSATPLRAQTNPAPKQNPMPTVVQPMNKATPPNPLTTETNPVPSSTPAPNEAQAESGQLGPASGASSGSLSQGPGEGIGAIRIASARILDNVEFAPFYNPKPAYPPIAHTAGIEGFVEVDLIINESGRVESFTIVKINGHSSFGDETAKVIGKWRFPPPRIKGQRVRVKYLYRVNFTLD
jgi:periplasmic protein TonB